MDTPDFTRIFLSKSEPCAPPSLFYTCAWHNLGKSLGEGLGLLCALFTSLWLYPFHLSIPLYPSLSLSLPLSPSLSLSLPLYPSLSLSLLLSPSLPLSLSPSLPPSLSLLSLPPSLYLSFYLSFSLFPSLSLLFIILFGVSNGRFRPCLFPILIYLFKISNITDTPVRIGSKIAWTRGKLLKFEIHFHRSGVETSTFEMIFICISIFFITWSFSFLNAFRISKVPEHFINHKTQYSTARTLYSSACGNPI